MAHMAPLGLTPLGPTVVKDIDILGGQTGGTPEIMKRSDSLEYDFEAWRIRKKRRFLLAAALGGWKNGW